MPNCKYRLTNSLYEFLIRMYVKNTKNNELSSANKSIGKKVHDIKYFNKRHYNNKFLQLSFIFCSVKNETQPSNYSNSSFF